MSWKHRGYPLGTLFVVVTTCAVLIAGVAPLARAAAGERPDVGTLLAALFLGAFVGMIVGATVGVLQFRPILGVLLGGAAGTVIGLASGAMALLSQKQVGPAAAAITAGSVLIVGVALVMRRTTAPGS